MLSIWNEINCRFWSRHFFFLMMIYVRYAVHANPALDSTSPFGHRMLLDNRKCSIVQHELALICIIIWSNQPRSRSTYFLSHSLSHFPSQLNANRLSHNMKAEKQQKTAPKMVSLCFFFVAFLFHVAARRHYISIIHSFIALSLSLCLRAVRHASKYPLIINHKA